MDENQDRLYYENVLWEQGKAHVAGIDEAGRGPLAGPVVAAAVIFDQNQDIIQGITDSKKLTSKKRNLLYDQIHNKAKSIGIGVVESREIDRINILQATYKAMRKAVARLKPQPDFLLIDGRGLPDKIYLNKGIPQGDKKCYSIGAASIIAKVYRDRMMIEYETIFPGYDFKKHKGYGTQAHREAIIKNFPTPIHRRSFKGVKKPYKKLLKSKNNRVVGTYGEHLAALHLHKKNFTIIERNYHCGVFGELDIIAQKGNILSFVEVKTHRGHYEPDETGVDENKMNQLGKIAEAYLSENPHPEMDCRFDVIIVQLNYKKTKIEHFENAFIL
ncbi:MAG: ribonuclease HII [Candidatus Marinimicrobia bacterium]|nr:ribonuclease HII [Candidatus Neomarinimicrobiota bacterium]